MLCIRRQALDHDLQNQGATEYEKNPAAASNALDTSCGRDLAIWRIFAC
jgi:hypothetical protein